MSDCFDCTPEEKLTGYGALLQYCDQLSGDFVTIAGTKDLEIPTRSRESIDTTDNDGDGWGTTIPSAVKRQEEVSYTFDFLAPQWVKLNNIFDSDRVLKWRLKLANDVAGYDFCAWIMSLGDPVPMEDLVQSEMTLMPTGRPTWFEGASP